MDIRNALKEQYHAVLAMLANCIERCPDDLWTSGTHPRTFWRIALHAAFFTHLYLGQDEAAFQPWTGGLSGYQAMWKVPAEVQPYDLPEEVAPLSREQTLDYITYIDGLLDPTIDKLDLDSSEAGFPWYKNINKLSHEMMNVRHTQGHIGQLSELLMARGIDTDWVSKASSRDSRKP